MTARGIGVATAAGMMVAALAMPAHAQSALDGPLAAPDASPAVTHAPAAHAKAKPRKAHHAAAKATKVPSTAADAEVPPAAGTPATHAGAPTDALDLGMKWNGSNDGSAQTKFQSGPNTSSGSGAEVGMKLHF